MKKIFLLVLFTVPLISLAQPKLSYDLIFSVSAVMNTSSESMNTSRNFSTFIIDSSGSPVITIPGNGTYMSVPKNAPIKYKGKLTGGFTIGCRLSYPVYKKLEVGLAASISWFKAARSVNNTGSFFSAGSFSGVGLSSSGNWDSIRAIAPGTYSYSNGLNSEDKFRFVTLNIPISLSYSIAKWQIEAGVISSFILSSKMAQLKPAFDSEISVSPVPSNPYNPQHSPKNESKSFFALSISPQYQISTKLKIGIEYNYALTNAYSTNWYSTNVYPSMKTSTLGLKILYNLN